MNLRTVFIQQTIRRFPRLTTFLFGIFSCILILFFLEVTFRIRSAVNRTNHSFIMEGAKSEYDAVLGFKPKPNSRNTATKKIDGELIYNAVYSIDQWSRRITPQRDLQNRKKFLVFFGCSFTFGEGLNDNETLPFFVSRLAPGYMIYNYAFSAYGTQQMLAKLQSDSITKEIQEPGGIGIYVYNAWHNPRTIGCMSIYNLWGRDMPYYFIDTDGKLKRNGSFTTGRRLRSLIYRLLWKSEIVRYFNIDIPGKITNEHFNLTCEIIRESALTLKNKFQCSEFYVLFHPVCIGEIEFMKAYFDKNGIKYLDYSQLLKNEVNPDKYLIKGDGHPNASLNMLLAERIVADTETAGTASNNKGNTFAAH